MVELWLVPIAELHSEFHV